MLLCIVTKWLTTVKVHTTNQVNKQANKETHSFHQTPVNKTNSATSVTSVKAISHGNPVGGGNCAGFKISSELLHSVRETPTIITSLLDVMHRAKPVHQISAFGWFLD